MNSEILTIVLGTSQSPPRMFKHFKEPNLQVQVVSKDSIGYNRFLWNVTWFKWLVYTNLQLAFLLNTDVNYSKCERDKQLLMISLYVKTSSELSLTRSCPFQNRMFVTAVVARFLRQEIRIPSAWSLIMMYNTTSF